MKNLKSYFKGRGRSFIFLYCLSFIYLIAFHYEARRSIVSRFIQVPIDIARGKNDFHRFFTPNSGEDVLSDRVRNIKKILQENKIDRLSAENTFDLQRVLVEDYQRIVEHIYPIKMSKDAAYTIRRTFHPPYLSPNTLYQDSLVTLVKKND